MNGQATHHSDDDEEKDETLSNTMRIDRKEVMRPIQVRHHAYLEVSGLKPHPVGFELDKESVTIGRHPSCDIHLPLANISRTHSRVVQENDEYFVEDLGSTNGTFVNSTRVVRCVLRNNDQIQIGEARIVFVEEKSRK
jgi:pSer/pThr/pTyr-binding forkhead associated (FHA) protein